MVSQLQILLTGASGFVGQAILPAARLRGFKIRPVYRSKDSAKGQVDAVQVSVLDGNSDWSNALDGVDIVIHVAARVHVMREKSLDYLAEYRRVNVDGTVNLARQAAATGAKRFVFISSIKVNGEATLLGRPFTADNTTRPEDAYGRSKAEAEAQLKKVAQETGIEVTIIRPPLIYGPGVKGNFVSLISCVRRGLPLPLGAVTQNRRSLVGLDNLVDLILVCATHPKAANETFLVSDGEDLSTTELLRRIGGAMRRPVRLLWVPTGIISFTAVALGKNLISQRLLGSLEVDMSKTCELLSWRPPVSVDEGLRRAVE